MNRFVIFTILGLCAAGSLWLILRDRPNAVSNGSTDAIATARSQERAPAAPRPGPIERIGGDRRDDGASRSISARPVDDAVHTGGLSPDWLKRVPDPDSFDDPQEATAYYQAALELETRAIETRELAIARIRAALDRSAGSGDDDDDTHTHLERKLELARLSMAEHRARRSHLDQLTTQRAD